MNAVKIILFVLAGILIIFGVLYILAAFNPDMPDNLIITGVILVLIAFGLIFFATRVKTKPADTNITYKIDLPAEVKMDTLKCQSCGGVLTMDNITMVAGAPVVNCPYCKTSYQLKEEPKW